MSKSKSRLGHFSALGDNVLKMSGKDQQKLRDDRLSGSDGHSTKKKSSATNVQVVVRCRPLNAREKDSGSSSILTTNVETQEIKLIAGSKTHTKGADKMYTFDKVYNQFTTQEQIYETTVAPIVEEVLDGYNCTVFAYGQTGTGKTHTMEGDLDGTGVSPNAGIIPRAIHSIFQHLDQKSKEYSVKISFLELYNEELCDLLADPNKNQELRLFEDATGKKGMLVHGLEEIITTSAEEVFDQLKLAQERRRTAETNLNKNSSRSHCVFTVTLHTKECTADGEDVIKTGKLNLVDLAGSECVGKSGAKNQQAKEAGKINQSLLTLGRVITALVEKISYVPYRDSKLTRLLQESLGGRAKTCIIATVSPAFGCFDESVSTLDYAHRAKNIRNRPTVNRTVSQKAYMRELVHEISMLKKENEALRHKHGIFLPPEKWAQVEGELQTKTARLTELEMTLKSKTDELAAMLTTFQLTQDQLTETIEQKSTIEAKLAVTCTTLAGTEATLAATEQNLDATTTELEATSIALGTTKHTLAVADEALDRTEVDLDHTRCRLSEAAFVVTKQGQTEEQLTAQAQDLRAVVEETIDVTDRLHAKIDRKTAVESSNLAESLAFQTTTHNSIDQLQQHLSAFCQFHQQSYLQLHDRVSAFTSHTTTSMGEQHVSLESMTTVLGGLEASMTARAQAQAQALQGQSSSFVQGFIASQEAIGSKVAATQHCLQSAVAALQQQMTSQQQQLQAWQEATHEDLDRNLKSVTSFAEMTAEAVRGLQLQAEQASGQQVEELQGNQAFLDTLTTQQEEDSERLSSSIADSSAQMTASLMSSIQDLVAKFTLDAQNSLKSQQVAVADATTTLRGSLSTQIASSQQRGAALAEMASNLDSSLSSFSTSAQTAHTASCQRLSSSWEGCRAGAAATAEGMAEMSARVEPELVSIMGDGKATTEAAQEYQEAQSTLFTTHRTAQEQAVSELAEKRSAFIQQQTDSAQQLSTFATLQGQDLSSLLQHHQQETTDQLSPLERENAQLKQSLDMYVQEGLRKDEPTGQTPMKQSFAYPTTFHSTAPHTALIEEFTAHHQEIDESETHAAKKSARVEERENPSMAVLDDADSIVDEENVELDLGEFADKENTGPVMEPGGVFIEIIKENASKPVPVGSEPLKEQMLPLGDTGVPTEEAEVEVGSRIPFAKHRTRTATS